jgi:hypothetical protein
VYDSFLSFLPVSSNITGAFGYGSVIRGKNDTIGSVFGYPLLVEYLRVKGDLYPTTNSSGGAGLQMILQIQSGRDGLLSDLYDGLGKMSVAIGSWNQDPTQMVLDQLRPLTMNLTVDGPGSIDSITIAPSYPALIVQLPTPSTSVLIEDMKPITLDQGSLVISLHVTRLASGAIRLRFEGGFILVSTITQKAVLQLSNFVMLSAPPEYG